MSETDNVERDALINGIREHFSDIRPYGEEDQDWTWADDGFAALETEDYGMAELHFQRLIASQPEHGDGYEGLALVYKTVGLKRQAVILIEEAARLAGEHCRKGFLDQEVVDDILREREEILAMEELPDAEEDAALWRDPASGKPVLPEW